MVFLDSWNKEAFCLARDVDRSVVSFYIQAFNEMEVEIIKANQLMINEDDIIALLAQRFL